MAGRDAWYLVQKTEAQFRVGSVPVVSVQCFHLHKWNSCDNDTHIYQNYLSHELTHLERQANGDYLNINQISKSSFFLQLYHFNNLFSVKGDRKRQREEGGMGLAAVQHISKVSN